MSKVCKITGKRPTRGNNVSHAHNRTKKVWEPNLQNKRLFNPETGEWIRVKLSARALRTISKKGLSAVLKEAGIHTTN